MADQEMKPEEVMDALRQKADELSRAGDMTEEKLRALPYSEQTKQLRETMQQLVSELHRMEKNLDSMLKHSEAFTSEGGTDNGND